MKLKEAVAQYLESLAADGRSPHTQGAYRRDLGVFLRFAGNVDLEAVTPALLQKFMASDSVQLGPTGARRAKASVNRYRVTLKALFAWAEARWYVPRNPTRVLKCARQRAVPRDILTDAEIESVLCAEYSGRNSLRDKAIVGFMLMTGCRLGETVALDVQDIDWQRGTVTLLSPKGGDPDRVPLSDRCLACLAPCRPGDDAPPSTPLFRSSRGERLSTRQVQRIVEARLREAGIDRHLTAHSLRHTFACKLYNATGDIRLVQTALRHEHLATTEIYAHVDPQRLRAAVNLNHSRTQTP